jgi:hypothetical protein
MWVTFGNQIHKNKQIQIHILTIRLLSTHQIHPLALAKKVGNKVQIQLMYATTFRARPHAGFFCDAWREVRLGAEAAT